MNQSTATIITTNVIVLSRRTRSSLFHWLILWLIESKVEKNYQLRAGRGGNNVLYGEATPRGPTPSAFIYHFWQKRHPFPITSIDKRYPLHLSGLKLCIPLNCSKLTVLRIWIDHKTERWSELYTHRLHLLALMNLFTDRTAQISLPLIYFNK